MPVATNNLLNGKNPMPRKYNPKNFEQGYNEIDWSKGRVLDVSPTNKRSKDNEEIQSINLKQNISNMNLILSATNTERH